MSSDLSIDASSPVPPFEQLRAQIASQAASGELPAGTKLATVRALAADLGLAANTVARAYRELEADGVITTHGRKGTFVSSDVLARRRDPTPHWLRSTSPRRDVRASPSRRHWPSWSAPGPAERGSP